ncbi:MAG: (Fe-S)-binding protein [Deltaproteobacteria bacterium]|nr:(Fe-S)-binding protein [Deltaproteobacteria bacterium]
MSDREAAKKTLLQEIAKCRSCRFCVDVCPTYQASDGLESMSAYGRLQIIKYLLQGTLPFDDALIHRLYSCLQCRRCERVCKSKGQNLDICRILRLGRALLSPSLVEGRGHETL